MDRERVLSCFHGRKNVVMKLINLHTPRFHFIIILTVAMLLVFSIFLMVNQIERPVAVARATLRVMPLGDSITYGVGSTTRGGYRVKLWQDCATAHLHVTFVGSQIDGPASLPYRENEGHPGWRINQIASRVVDWLKTYQPQVILLQIGTNDIVYNDHVSTAPQRLRSLLLQISETLPNAKILVAQITPLRNTRWDAEVVTYNAAIPAMVTSLAAQGLPVRYVDMYHAVPVSNLGDGIHPNDSGYASMASVWYHGLHAAIK